MEPFCKNSNELFSWKSSIVDVRLGSKYAPDSIHPSWLFLCKNNSNLLILLNAQIIRYPRYNMKNKIATLTIFNKFYVFCTSIPGIAHYIFFSMSFYLLIVQNWIQYWILLHITGPSNQLSKWRKTDTFKEGLPTSLTFLQPWLGAKNILQI